MSLNNLISIKFLLFLVSMFLIVPIKIPAGKIVDLPPVITVSPIFIAACLGTSCS
jgi:hypothetical protein